MPQEITVTTSISGFLNLPPEVILEIYSWATLDRYDDADLTRRSPRGTLLSHICRSLRSLAISSQGLWDYVPLCLSAPWTELCLARAPTAPLRINLRAYLDDEEHQASNTLVLPHLSRARYLRLYVEFNYDTVNDELTRIFEAFTSFSMPLLGTFDVCFETIDFEDRNYSCLNLPQPLFSGVPPAQLKHLILRQAATLRSTLPATMPISAFSTVLRSLDLYNSHLWKNVDEMVQFFQTIPLLEKLAYTLTGFDRHLFDTTPSQSHSPRCVRMDHLQTFETTEYALFSAAMAVFTYLALPPRATIVMFVDNDADWIGEHSTFENYVTLGAQVMREHFATAIAAGEHYDCLHINEKPAHATESGRRVGFSPSVTPYSRPKSPASPNISAGVE
ncbi:hypothetical protein PENSPDRAFT_685589 [Peniophora sp. CONT]|nr:hypothetical protein PENSPDRAFT_685589 [Peniophora sp. CONT]